MGLSVTDVIVRNSNFRWPVEIPNRLLGQTLLALSRRGKYLLFRFQAGTQIVHLGMSGSLRVTSPAEQIRPHDHIDWCFSTTRTLRFNDPRRFGSVHWTTAEPLTHRLLRHLGPEPLEANFDADYIYQVSRGKKTSIKNFLMDSRVVVGVGNIYANEALFRARIRPTTRAGSMSRLRLRRLVEAVRTVLQEAIELGGTTLRDFLGSNGEPGYFSQELFVYGRAGAPCLVCERKLKGIVLGQRQTVYCSSCQPR